MATSTTPPAPARATTKQAKAKPKAAPPVTTVILVRHGQTPSTGKILPGRAPGLHLADAGRGYERFWERVRGADRGRAA